MGNVMDKNINADGGNVVLCAANGYTQKFFLNPEFSKLPEDVKKELKLIAVSFTEEVGGIFLMEFRKDGQLLLKSMHEDQDYGFDSMEASDQIDTLSKKYEGLFAKLGTFYVALQSLKEKGIADMTLSDGESEELLPSDNPEGHAEIRHATAEEEAEQGGIRKTGEWDMPVMPDDPDAESTAYHTVFGD